MPIEKAPTNPLPKGPRPGKPHRVTDDETLESVAHKYGVPVKTLILHNFGTLDPTEINWYLHYYVGCKLPTHDHKNWRFSRAAMTQGPPSRSSGQLRTASLNSAARLGAIASCSSVPPGPSSTMLQ